MLHLLFLREKPPPARPEKRKNNRNRDGNEFCEIRRCRIRFS